MIIPVKVKATEGNPVRWNVESNKQLTDEVDIVLLKYVAPSVYPLQISSLSNSLISTASPCWLSRIYRLKSVDCARAEK